MKQLLYEFHQRRKGRRLEPGVRIGSRIYQSKRLFAVIMDKSLNQLPIPHILPLLSTYPQTTDSSEQEQ